MCIIYHHISHGQGLSLYCECHYCDSHHRHDHTGHHEYPRHHDSHGHHDHPGHPEVNMLITGGEVCHAGDCVCSSFA